MLLVDDDQPEVVDRREHRRARTDADPRLALAQAPPLGVALAGVSRECSTATVSPKRSTKRADDLRRERDLGHQHDRAAALLERRRGGPQVDLGLARAGDAVQQPLLGAALAQRVRAAARAPRAVRASARGARGLRAPTGSAAGARRRAACARSSRRAAPGGSTSASARAIVEQYSAAIQSASATSSAGTPSSSARSGASSLLLGDLAAVGQPDDDAEHLARGRTARPASSRRRRRRELARAAGSRTARAARGCVVIGSTWAMRGHRPDPRAPRRSEAGGRAQRARPCRSAPR